MYPPRLSQKNGSLGTRLCTHHIMFCTCYITLAPSDWKSSADQRGENSVSMTTSSLISRSSHHILFTLQTHKSWSFPVWVWLRSAVISHPQYRLLRDQVPSVCVGNARDTACSICGWMCAQMESRPCPGWLNLTCLETHAEHSQKLHGRPVRKPM